VALEVCFNYFRLYISLFCIVLDCWWTYGPVEWMNLLKLCVGCEWYMCLKLYVIWYCVYETTCMWLWWYVCDILFVCEMNVKLEQILISRIEYSLVSSLFSMTYRKSPKVRIFWQKTSEITTVFFATKPEAVENHGLIFGGSKQPPKINGVG
jgi:hypothetical protein